MFQMVDSLKIFGLNWAFMALRTLHGILWHFATPRNCCFLTVGRQLKNPNFYEHLWHLAGLHTHHRTSSIKHVLLYTFSVSGSLVLSASIRFSVTNGGRQSQRSIHRKLYIGGEDQYESCCCTRWISSSWRCWVLSSKKFNIAVINSGCTDHVGDSCRR